MPQLTYVLRGVRRLHGSCTSRARQLITPVELRAMKSVWAKRSPSFDAVMLLTSCCTGFFGFLRAGEFTVDFLGSFGAAVHLTHQDVSTDSHSNPSTVCLHLKQSKTDPFRLGADIFLGRSQSDFCLVSALLAYT
jgi:hypothetical protein